MTRPSSPAKVSCPAGETTGSSGWAATQIAHVATTMAPSTSERRIGTRNHHSVSGTATNGRSQADRSPAREMPETSRTSVTTVLGVSRPVVAASEPSSAERATVMTATANTGFPAVDPEKVRSGTTAWSDAGQEPRHEEDHRP